MDYTKLKKLSKILFISSFFVIAACANKQAEENPLTKIPYLVGVNKYVWYSAIQTLNFLPIESVDPYGGVIVSGWYTTTDGNSRYRVNVFVLEQQLTSSSVSVRVFKQTKKANNWVSAPVPPTIQRELENVILINARNLRNNEKTITNKK